MLLQELQRSHSIRSTVRESFASNRPPGVMVGNINDSGVVIDNLSKVVSPRLPEPTLLIIIYVHIAHSVGQH